MVQLAVDLVVLALFLFCAQEGLRRSGPWAAWIGFGALPAILTCHWLQTDQLSAFQWVKLYTSFFNVFWLTGLRFTRLGTRLGARNASLLVLAANILEAVALDVFGESSAHRLHVVTGLCLIVTLWRTAGTIWIDTGGRQRDLLYDGMTRGWIVGYTLWNWTFVYLNFPWLAGQQVAALASSFVVGMIDPRRWAQARTVELASHLLLLSTFLGFMSQRMDTANWTTGSRGDLAAGTCLIMVAVYTVWLLAGRSDKSPDAVAPGTLRQRAAEPDAQRI